MVATTALVFPGQGSQAVGMLAEYVNDYPIVMETFKQASSVLDYDLWQLVTAGPIEKLNQTEYTQPALLAAGVAVWRVYQQQGLDANLKYLAGHSLGEYTALVCAEALSFLDGIKLVAMRGRLMQQAEPGAMAAIIGLSLAEVNELCQQNSQGQLLQPANINAPTQIVIAGAQPAIARAAEQAKSMGAQRAIILPVSVAAHCELMRPVATKLQPHIEAINWQLPKFPVIQNFDAASHNDVNAICAALLAQLYSPVRWVEIIEDLIINKKIARIIECGPGKVLTGLTKRISKNLKVGVEVC